MKPNNRWLNLLTLDEARNIRQETKETLQTRVRHGRPPYAAERHNKAVVPLNIEQYAYQTNEIRGSSVAINVQAEIKADRLYHE